MRIALIGCGIHAQRVLIPAAQLVAMSISAVADPVEERRIGVAKRTRAVAHATVGELLAGGDFDAIVAAPAPAAHSAVLKEVLAAGRPVFIEKPAGWTSEAIREAEELARDSGAKVQVGFMRRFAPAYRLAKSLAAAWDGLTAVQGRVVCGPSTSEEVFLKDVAIHYLDLCRFLLGEAGEVDAVRMQSSQGSAWHVRLSCEHGVAALLLSDRGTWGNPTEHYWLDGPGQAVEISNVASVRHYRSGRQNPSDDLASKLPSVGVLELRPNLASTGLTHQSTYMQGYVPELQAFAQTVQLGAPPQVGLADARAAMEIAERVLARAGSAGEEA